MDLADAIRAHRCGDGVVLAESARARTTRQGDVVVGAVVVKEVRRRAGVLARVASLVRTSRARRAHEAALVLARAGVPVAESLGFVDESDRSFHVARFVAGPRLDRVLAEEPGRIPELALEAARLAARIHAAGVAHGDLKPQNLVVTSAGLVVIDLDAAIVGPVPSRRRRARDLAALDAYGQRGPLRVPRRVRRAACDAYLALAPFESDARALLRAVKERSLLKRARWLEAARG